MVGIGGGSVGKLTCNTPQDSRFHVTEAEYSASLRPNKAGTLLVSAVVTSSAVGAGLSINLSVETIL